MGATQTINANLAECLKSAMHWGFTRVHNVCAGTTNDVPFGLLDWIACFGVGALMLAFTLCFFGMFISTIRDC